jgi:hypothetical protein
MIKAVVIGAILALTQSISISRNEFKENHLIGFPNCRYCSSTGKYACLDNWDSVPVCPPKPVPKTC